MQTSALRLSDGPRLDGVRVLVVNDMRPVRQVVTDILECAGATVTAVDSAEDALDVLQRERPNVPLSDLSMPEGKDGYWLIGQVRAPTAGARWHHPRRRPHQLHRPRTPRERAASFAFICQERERTRAKVPPSKIRTS